MYFVDGVSYLWIFGGIETRNRSSSSGSGGFNKGGENWAWDWYLHCILHAHISDRDLWGGCWNKVYGTPAPLLLSCLHWSIHATTPVTRFMDRFKTVSSLQATTCRRGIGSPGSDHTLSQVQSRARDAHGNLLPPWEAIRAVSPGAPSNETPESPRSFHTQRDHHAPSFQTST